MFARSRGSRVDQYGRGACRRGHKLVRVCRQRPQPPGVRRRMQAIGHRDTAPVFGPVERTTDKMGLRRPVDCSGEQGGRGRAPNGEGGTSDGRVEG